MKHLLAAALLLGLAPAGAPRPALLREPPILMFHRVSPRIPADPIGRELTVTPQAFGADLTWLRVHGIRAIDLAQLDDDLARGIVPPRTVVVTFDDGYAGQARYALPLLRRVGDHATLFIVTGMLGRAGHLTWRDLHEMLRAGMEIGGHGVMHLDLSTMTSAQQTAQIDGCITALQRRLRIRVRSYAYPSGRLNRATLAIVARAGIALAVTTDPIYVIPPQNRYELTRLRVRHDWTAAQFGAALTTAFTHEPTILRQHVREKTFRSNRPKMNRLKRNPSTTQNAANLWTTRTPFLPPMAS